MFCESRGVETVDETIAGAAERLRRGGVVGWSHVAALRHVVRLAVPSLLLLLAVVVAVLCAIVMFGDSIVLVDERPHLVGAGRGLLVWGVMTAAVWVAAQVVVFPATVMLAAGVLLDRPVSVRAAMREAVRRLPTMVCLAALATVTLAAAFWVFERSEAEGVAVLVVGLPALLGVPALLAVPGVVLEGRSAVSGVRRAYGLAREHFWSVTLTLVFGGVAVPALACLIAAVSTPVVAGTALSVLGLIATPCLATVSAGTFLHRVASSWDDSVLASLRDGLPAGPGRPARGLPVLVAAVLPGLLYGAAVLVNPFGWPEIQETVVTRSWKPGITDDGPEMGHLDSGGVRGVHTGPGAYVAALMDSEGPPVLLTCADPACDTTTHTWAEPGDPETRGFPTAYTRLPGGRFAVTVWRRFDRGEPRTAELGLLVCDARACVLPSDGTALLRRTDILLADYGIMSLAARPGGGLVLARTEEYDPPGSMDPSDRQRIVVVTCPDLVCARPSAKEIGSFATDAAPRRANDLAVAVGADERPVVAHMDVLTGAVHVLSCLDPACAGVRVTRPVAPGPRRDPDLVDQRAAVTAAVRRDGRPVIAYRDVHDGSIRLLDCLTQDCRQASTAALTGAQERPAEPALLLDAAGRTRVAYEDMSRAALMLASCAGARCASAPVGEMAEHDANSRLAMTLDTRGRPVIAWGDGTGKLYEREWRLMLSTVRSG